MNPRTVRVVITGVGGRMGQALLAALQRSPQLRLTGATEAPDHALKDRPIAVPNAIDEATITVSSDIEPLVVQSDVVVDFTGPTAAIAAAEACARHGVALVTGTTGFSDEQRARLQALTERIPLLMSPNMSIGVNLLFQMVQQAARAVGTGWDLEVVEVHHRHKKDAPSGTAARLIELLATSRESEQTSTIRHGREGLVGARPAGEIGVHAVRGGDVVGDHTVLLLGDGERLELTHRATSRENFAAGALRAAQWLAGRPPGLYGMADVLGIKADA